MMTATLAWVAAAVLLGLAGFAGLWGWQRMTREQQAQRVLQALNRQLEESIAQLREKEALLVQMAQSDGLTRIANRRRFDEEFQREWLQCQRNQVPLAVALVDLDFFKQFNDHYGHLAGDACLQSVARAMRERLGRPHDLVARYGGEEFVVLLPDTSLAGATKVAERLRQAVADLAIPHAQSAVATHVTISIGVQAVVPSDTSSQEALLRAADAALYEAKARGRDRICGQ